MTAKAWPTTQRSVTSLHLDPKNPRLGRETSRVAPREILQYLFENDKAYEIARSIASRGFYPNEPLLAIKDDGLLIVVEGNRRLAALKALIEPGLLEGKPRRQIETLARKINDEDAIRHVPVTLAPSRLDTDSILAGRHHGTPVLPWQAENRASFILEKLEEGYTNDQLLDRLHFTLSDIQAARQTRAIADMARSLKVSPEVMAKIQSPRANLFSTLGRVFDSPIGRKYLMVEKDHDNGLRGVTTKTEFERGFTKLVTDIALKKETSRSLNKTSDIEAYFKGWDQVELPKKKRGKFIPADLVKGKTVASSKPSPKPPAKRKPATPASVTVLPKDFKVRTGGDRLKDIRQELTKLKREDFPNAGAVLLRVFFELSVLDYLERMGELPGLVKRLEKKTGRRLPFGVPTLGQLRPEIVRIAKKRLPINASLMVEKAVRKDNAAPFTINELHGFVHGFDMPTGRDIEQFWKRTEPLLRMMLEEGDEGQAK